MSVALFPPPPLPIILLPGEAKPIVVVNKDNPLQTDHPILNTQLNRKVKFPLALLDEEASQTISEMLATVEKLQGMAGLAAPQIGKNLQIFIHQISEEGGLADKIIVVINPRITNRPLSKLYILIFN